MASKQEWSDWKQQAVTKELVKHLCEKREAVKEGLAEQQYGDTDYLKYIGYAQALKDSINYIIEDFGYIMEEQDD